MTTSIEGKEFGKKVIDNSKVIFSTGNRFYDLILQDGPNGGKAETRFNLFGIHLPIGGSKSVEVNLTNPHGTIWDANREFLDVWYREKAK